MLVVRFVKDIYKLSFAAIGVVILCVALGGVIGFAQGLMAVFFG